MRQKLHAFYYTYLKEPNILVVSRRICVQDTTALDKVMPTHSCSLTHVLRML